MKIFTAHTAGMYYRYTRFLGAMLIVALIATSYALAIPTLNLLSTSNFVVLAGSTVTGTPSIHITGDVGLSPAAGSYIAGFDGTNVTGILYVVDASGPAGSVVNATLLQTAKSDLTTAYNDAAGRTPVPTGPFLNPNGGNIGGQNLVPGLYKFTSECQITGTDLTLTGSASDVWIFQIASLLNLGSGIHIILAGGAQATNIFWQVGTSATLGTYSVFKGTILADQSISLDVGATMDGRALAFSGAVTMHDAVTGTRADLTTAPIFSVDSAQVRFGNVSNGFSKKDTVTVSNTGTANLIISSITSSNTLFTVTPTSGTITPGSTQKFYVTFSPLTDSMKNGYIYFHHNAANAKDSIAVSGTGASPKFSVSPLNLDFGNVTIGITKMDTVTVTNTGTANLIIYGATSSNLYFTVTPIIAMITPNSTQKFFVTFAPLKNGQQNGYIMFNDNAGNGNDQIGVSGSGVSPKFSISPLSIDFGNVNNANTKMDSVTVTNTGTGDLIISSFTSSNAHFTILTNPSTIITAGSSQKFYITFTPLTSGMQNGFIRFTFNATNAKDSIYVTGTGVGNTVAPIFSANPLSLNFGNVNDGTMKTDSVIITNTGTADLIILGFTSNNVYYNPAININPHNAIITPGTSQKY
ncbi:MAG: ice-binding family protein, partial [FCB group bacterium]